MSEKTALDVVFVLDTTGSMNIRSSRAWEFIDKQAQEIVQESDLDVRFGLVEYRDHDEGQRENQDPSWFVTRSHPFESLESLGRTIRSRQFMGGCDEPEAVFDGLVAASEMPFRPGADRIAFLIGDSSPHGYDHKTVASGADSFPEGCPCHATPGGVAEALGVHNVRLYVVDPSPSKMRAEGLEILTEIARVTGGGCIAGGTAYKHTFDQAQALIDQARLYERTLTEVRLAGYLNDEAEEEVARRLDWPAKLVDGVREYLFRRQVAR